MKSLGGLLVCALVSACGGRADRPQLAGRPSTLASSSASVLFLGNSLVATQATTGDDMPAVLKRFAAAKGRTLAVSEAIDLGHTLLDSWSAGIPQPYLAGQYDFVVYQEYSTLWVDSPDQFFSTALTTYQPAVQKALKPGAQEIVFKDWVLVDPSPYATRAQAAAALDTVYAQLSTELTTPNVTAPFGPAWNAVFASKPLAYLFLADGKHPNDAGIYLNACVMYVALYGESPVGLPALFLPAADAAFLQGIAATFVPAAPPLADAGTPGDAGTPADAGTPPADAGTTEDAGPPPAPPDPGPPASTPAPPPAATPDDLPAASPPGRGCASAGATAAWLASLGALAFAAGRRRRASS